ncbi:MAG: hypothetical protein R3E04_09415 [Sphingobium sp.]
MQSRKIRLMRKRFVRRLWNIRAQFGLRWGSGVKARIGVASDALAIKPNGRRRVYLSNVKEGRYEFHISHEDYLLWKQRRGLVARFGFVTGKISPSQADVIGLPLSDDRKVFAYMGEGRRSGGEYRQVCTLNIPQFQKHMYVELTTTLDRFVNVNSVTLSNASLSLLELERAVQSWLDRTSNAPDARFLLYADINLNIVDGSSIWLSSMASVLCRLGPCILILKTPLESDIVYSNIENRSNLIVISPEDLEFPVPLCDVETACAIARFLDNRIPSLRNLVVRGLDASAQMLENRQFRERMLVYLTDFYRVDAYGLQITEEQRSKSVISATHAACILAQTLAIAEKLHEITDVEFPVCLALPAVPDELPLAKGVEHSEARKLSIGYAGKINPDWGVTELLDCAQMLRKEGVDSEINIVANKISDGLVPGFRTDILTRMAEAGAKHFSDFNRDQSMRLMVEMDFVWCWRPARLEENTLELSTKLVEMASCGARCICYPSKVNRELLGDDYPFFARNMSDIKRILDERTPVPQHLAERIRQRHSVATLSANMVKTAFNPAPAKSSPKICFSGHDFKFIDAYISHLKAQGVPVIRDRWEWGEAVDADRSKMCHEWADVVFCEWGLANAVWHSQNKVAGKRLFIRAHLQEIGVKAQKFGKQIDIGNVDCVIFVSARVRDEAMRLFGWPIEKTTVISNYLLTDEYRFRSRGFQGPIRLGMVGIIPQRKRFDRAVELLARLQERGQDASLSIKGPRPETLDFMRAPGRRAELVHYEEVYAQIDGDQKLSSAVSFQDWGNDVAHWYRDIDYILSPSDFESFHYALADGVLSGCYPLIWPWDESEVLYSGDWIVQDVADAVRRIEVVRGMTKGDRELVLKNNRALVEKRYGHRHVFNELNIALGLEGIA